jgi:hypothetical protein
VEDITMFNMYHLAADSQQRSTASRTRIPARKASSASFDELRTQATLKPGTRRSSAKETHSPASSSNWWTYVLSPFSALSVTHDKATADKERPKAKSSHKKMTVADKYRLAHTANDRLYAAIGSQKEDYRIILGHASVVERAVLDINDPNFSIATLNRGAPAQENTILEAQRSIADKVPEAVTQPSASPARSRKE